MECNKDEAIRAFRAKKFALKAQDLFPMLQVFAILPSEIIIDILSRLSVRTVINCKCVCKSWLQLVETHAFVKSHLSKSFPGIAVAILSQVGIIEFTDINEHNMSLQANAITKLHIPNFPNSSTPTFYIHGSADGLLLLHKLKSGTRSYTLLLCNPITREYISLNPQQFLSSLVISFGFGKSKISGKYKVVMLTQNKCLVYTLGTGSWRSIASDAMLDHKSCVVDNGAFVNGNIHWVACDLKDGSPRISCFDLETELFTTFSAPLPASDSRTSDTRLCAFEGRLCLCFNTSKDESEIWLMNEYGMEKSWTKIFGITGIQVGGGGVIPFIGLKNGDTLLSCDRLVANLFYVSNKNGTVRRIDIPGGICNLTPVLHISSFLSLKSFVMEKTISY